MAKSTSPSWIWPLCSAGCPGKSCFIRIRLPKSRIGGSSSHMRKLNPRPLALLVKVTSWVLSEGFGSGRMEDEGRSRTMTYMLGGQDLNRMEKMKWIGTNGGKRKFEVGEEEKRWQRSFIFLSFKLMRLKKIKRKTKSLQPSQPNHMKCIMPVQNLHKPSPNIISPQIYKNKVNTYPRWIESDKLHLHAKVGVELMKYNVHRSRCASKWLQKSQVSFQVFHLATDETMNRSVHCLQQQHTERSVMVIYWK